ncbi:MAG TPA: GAF and ANTAR domain-containing protein [Acidimicrobiales bacterium]|nr:GAF and ANTAR domain-containing protein [Acidimicrobiales bacterium]
MGVHADDSDIAGALVDFARSLGGHDSIEAVLKDLSDRCVELLPADGVGVLLLEDSDLTVSTSNSEVGARVEELEVVVGDGPCVEAVRTGRRILVPDLEAVADHYPEFVPKALDAGARSIHALPLTGRGDLVGALDIINCEPTALTPTQLGTAQMLADVAVSYIYAVRLHERSSRLAEQLQSALDSRVVIEQAKGVLAERHGDDMQAAFERLRRHARGNNLTVRSVAQQTVDGTLRL